MVKDEDKLEKIISIESKRVQKKRPFLERIEVTYEEDHKGKYNARLRAKTKKKNFYIKEENRCPEQSIKKAFANLTKLVKKEDFKRNRRLSTTCLSEVV